MGGRQFDDLVRTLQERQDRRGALRGAAAGVLGLTGLATVVEPTLAKSCKKKKDCPKGKKCKHKEKQPNGKRRGRCK